MCKRLVGIVAEVDFSKIVSVEFIFFLNIFNPA